MFPNPEQALSDWLSANNVSQAQLAEKIGVHRSTIFYYTTGGRRPRADTAYLIEQVTNGDVPMAMWFVPKSLQDAAA